MHIAGMILGCLLLGQASDATFAPAAGQPIRQVEQATALTPLAPNGPTTGARQGRRQPPEMVAEAIVLPSGSKITGQPMPLLNIIKLSTDRRQQLEMVRGYWRLAQSVAEYRFCWEHVQTLQGFRASGDATALRVAQASAMAQLYQAEVDATAAQYDLAKLTRLPAGSPLPVPSDRPHVGAYRTNFQELYGMHIAPESAMMLDRILPVRRQAIDEQAAAVQTAEDVLATASERPGNLNETVACSQDLLTQRRTFMRIVCDYNRNIAEYGLAVAGPITPPQTLVSMLIGPQTITPVVARTAPPAATQPSSPANPSDGSLRTGWRTGQPTPAVRRNDSDPRNEGTPRNQPTPATPDGRRSASIERSLLSPANEQLKLEQPGNQEIRPASNIESVPAATLRGDLQPVGKAEPTLAPVQKEEKKPKRPINLEDALLAPVELPNKPPRAEKRTTQKPIAAENTVATAPLYSALANVSPVSRAKQLTVALHWDRSLPKNIGKPMNLAECLVRDPGTDRRATIEAFWRVRQHAAEYQAYAQQAELLDAMTPVALDRRNDAVGAIDMLRLHWAQRATQALMFEAHAALVEAQYALAVRIGATRDPQWPLASTAPHAGTYLLKLESQPQAVAESWPVRRLSTTIPALSQGVQQRATAVVEADSARVAITDRYRSGGATIDQAIKSVLTQTNETIATLETLTDYNNAVADYVLTVVPATTPVDRIVSALVVKP
jgi:hypothetical protein